MSNASLTPPHRFRFSLRTLFVLVTVAAVMLAVCRAFPEVAFALAVSLACAIALMVPLAIVFAAAYLVKSLLMAASSIAQRFAHRN